MWSKIVQRRLTVYWRIILWVLPPVNELPTFPFLGFYSWDVTARHKNLWIQGIVCKLCPIRSVDREERRFESPLIGSHLWTHRLRGHVFGNCLVNPRTYDTRKRLWRPVKEIACWRFTAAINISRWVRTAWFMCFYVTGTHFFNFLTLHKLLFWKPVKHQISISKSSCYAYR